MTLMLMMMTGKQMANLKELPESLAVIGGGVIGVEYATILAQLGVSTSILCKVRYEKHP